MGNINKKKKIFEEIPYIERDSLILKKIDECDKDKLDKLRKSDLVYKYLPTFLFEQKYSDIDKVKSGLYTELIDNKESVILVIYLKDGLEFCGICELYGFKDKIHKISIGYRLAEEYWGREIATKTVSIMIDYLYQKTDTEIITASTIIENKALANVLRKNGFDLVLSAVPEDWGYPEPTISDKWIR